MITDGTPHSFTQATYHRKTKQLIEDYTITDLSHIDPLDRTTTCGSSGNVASMILLALCCMLEQDEDSKVTQDSIGMIHLRYTSDN